MGGLPSYQRIEIARDQKELTRGEFAERIRLSGVERLTTLAQDVSLTRAEWRDKVETTKSSNQRELTYELESLDAGRRTPTIFSVRFEYDALNRFGALIRGRSICEYFSESGNDKRPDEFSVEIDGQTNFDRLLEEVQNSR